MNPFDGISGLVARSEAPPPAHRLGFDLAPDVDAAAIRAVAGDVVVRLPENWHLDWFDAQYPSVSDPGGYVTLLRLRGDESGGGLRICVANHGWGSGWAVLSGNEAAAYLALCLAGATPVPFARPGSAPGLTLSSGPAGWPGDRRSAVHVRAYLSERLAPTP